MIKRFNIEELDDVMKIWLDTNIDAHKFIEEDYWIKNFEMVKEMIPNADIYVFYDEGIIKGFIGIVEESYIAGLFVMKLYQGKGIGKKLIDYCKEKYKCLSLDVYEKNKEAVNFYSNNNFKVVEKKINEETREVEYNMIFDNK